PNTYPNPAADLDHAQVAYSGIVLRAGMAGDDMPLSHEYREGNCDWDIIKVPLQAAIDTFDYLLATEIAAPAFAKMLLGDYCPSDYDIHVRPIRGYERMLIESADNLALEIENHFYAQAPPYMKPQPGDLLFTTGRFIV